MVSNRINGGLGGFGGLVVEFMCFIGFLMGTSAFQGIYQASATVQMIIKTGAMPYVTGKTL
jgi:hypothetical protein